MFVTACAIRAAERAHGYHNVLHDFTEQVERLLTAAVLFLLGAFVALGGLSALSWWGAATACMVLLVIRPLAGWAGLLRSSLGTGNAGSSRHTASGGSAPCTTLPTPWASTALSSRSGSYGQW